MGHSSLLCGVVPLFAALLVVLPSVLCQLCSPNVVTTTSSQHIHKTSSRGWYHPAENSYIWQREMEETFSQAEKTDRA